MKFGEEVVEILEAFDLTGTYRGAGELAECAPNTVARHVALREVGLPQSRRLRRAGLMDGYLEKIEEWVNASRGTVRADVVSRKLAAIKEANLRDQYSSFRELEAEVNGREQRTTRRIPGEMVVEERARLHPLPKEPYTLAFGVARRVGQTTAMVSYEGGSYSVPDQLVGQVVWVRGHGEEVSVVHVGREGPKEVARHPRTTPGTPRVDDRQFPVRQSDPLDRQPRARTQEEAEVLQLGPQAAAWLKAAGAAGAPRVRSKMALAVSLAKVLGGSRVAEALGKAAASGRFADGDLESVVAHLTSSQVGPVG